MTRILFIGDIVGRPGRKIVKTVLSELMKTEAVDLVVANGENAAGGFGLSLEVTRELLFSGIDVITLGNHTWDNRDIYNVLDQEPRVVRPANYPDGTPGAGSYLAISAKGEPVGVINLLGQVFLEALQSPFQIADELVSELSKETKIILVDIHAEATSEKMALGWYLDGRVSAVLGTHTHIETADERVLPQGTAYITDVGMTGPINSVLGVDSELVLKKFLTKRPVKFEVAGGPIVLHGVVLEISATGLATSIKRVKRELE